MIKHKNSNSLKAFVYVWATCFCVDGCSLLKPWDGIPETRPRGHIQFSHQSNTGNCRYGRKNPASSENQLELASALVFPLFWPRKASSHLFSHSIQLFLGTVALVGLKDQGSTSLVIWHWVKTPSHFFWGTISIYQLFQYYFIVSDNGTPWFFHGIFTKGKTFGETNVIQ